MAFWGWCAAAILLGGCVGGFQGPTEEQLGCYRACGRDKDRCILDATTAREIQACDSLSARCSQRCR